VTVRKQIFRYVHVYVCMYGPMYPPLAPEMLDGFGSYSVTGRFPVTHVCPGSSHIDPSHGLQTHGAKFLENCSLYCVEISVLGGGRRPKWNCIGSVLRKRTSRPLRERNLEFVEIGSTGRKDFVVTSSCLPSRSRFHFQRNVVHEEVRAICLAQVLVLLISTFF
jgi:hypothetical protein